MLNVNVAWLKKNSTPLRLNMTKYCLLTFLPIIILFVKSIVWQNVYVKNIN